MKLQTVHGAVNMVESVNTVAAVVAQILSAWQNE